jgi:proline iminopeptidase
MRKSLGAIFLLFGFMALVQAQRVAKYGPSPVSFHHVWMPNLKYEYFESNGAELFYEVGGDGSEALVVVHGAPGLPHDYLHPMLSTLGRYFKVIYFDRRAEGLPGGRPRSVMSLPAMVEDLEALRRAAGLNQMTLLGHGFGGTVALSYALHYPDRVKQLVLVGASAVVESPEYIESRLLGALPESERAAYQAALESQARELVRYRILFPACFHRRPDPTFLDGNAYSLYFQMMARRHLLANDPGGADLRGALDLIKSPALILVGRYDLIVPLGRASELAAGLPKSRLIIMEHSGHFPYLEESYRFTQWVKRFLEGGVSPDNRREGSVAAGR